MNTDSSTSENDGNLSGLGRALMGSGTGTGSGSKPSAAWIPPTAEELHQILPQYEIVKMLGRGGMGAVYMGTQTSLERSVAIKILSAALEDSDAGFTQRFKNEAKAMARLNHPGIVSVYDFGEAPGGLLYIVMEYVDGTDVAKMIAAKGRLHTEHAMAVTAHVCDALAYAHERGIIHRDIKPANIMVGYDGAVKVADFGLAKVNAGGSTLGLTQSGMAMGTLHYMAPEALMLGTAVDHRADIYAVGVMLYQTLTGKLPQGMFKMPSLLVPGLDPRYDGIIAKAIMEDREARYQSAREMRSDLDSILTQPVVKVEAPPAKAAAAGAPLAGVLPTGARPQRPGARQSQPSAHAQAPYQPPARSLAWLWVLLVLAALGGVVWRLLEQPAKSKIVSTPSDTPETSSKTVAPATPPPASAKIIAPPSTPPPPAAATQPSATTTAPATTTPVEAFGHRYQFVAGATSWEEARAKAQGLGGHLAVITSKEENDWLLNTYRGLLTTTNRNIWLGAIEDKPNAGWKWITGEAFTPLGWGNGEPNGTRGGGGQVGHPFMLNFYSFKDSVVGWNDSSTHSSQTRDNIGFIVEWDTAPAAAPPALPKAVASATTWVDNRDRVLQARFVSLAGDNLVLEAAGKIYPLALTSLSPASQQIARQLAATRSPSAAALPGLWTQVIPPVSGKPSETQIFASQRAMFTGGGKQVQGSWTLEGGLLKMSWENGSRYELSSSGSADVLEGTRFDPRGDSMPLRLVRNPAAAQVRSQIPADAISNGTSRFAYYPGTFTWKEAKARAEALGGHLATITTTADNAWVVANFLSKVTPSRKQFWIGASQETPDQPWQWVTGEPFSLTHWAPGEPNNAKGTDAKSKPPYMLGYLYQGGRMGWNDFSESQLNWRDVIVGYLVEWDNAPAGSASTAAPPVEDGFIDLFSPSERLAWRQCGKGGITFDNDVATTWVSGRGLGVPWYAKRMFTNFVFKVEFRARQPLFNSGLRLRFPNPGDDTKVVSMEGYEVNIADNGASPANGDTFPTGGFAHLQGPSASPHRTLGEWNELEVTATGQSYTVVLNGQVVNRFTGNRRTEGYVGLENHTRGAVQFRNVRIKPLP